MKALLVLSVTALHLAIIVERVGTNQLIPDTEGSSGISNSVYISLLLLEERLVI